MKMKISFILLYDMSDKCEDIIGTKEYIENALRENTINFVSRLYDLNEHDFKSAGEIKFNPNTNPSVVSTNIFRFDAENKGGIKSDNEPLIDEVSQYAVILQDIVDKLEDDFEKVILSIFNESDDIEKVDRVGQVSGFMHD